MSDKTKTRTKAKTKTEMENKTKTKTKAKTRAKTKTKAMKTVLMSDYSLVNFRTLWDHCSMLDGAPFNMTEPFPRTLRIKPLYMYIGPKQRELAWSGVRVRVRNIGLGLEL